MYGGHSPKPLNGSNRTTQLKSSTDNIHKSKKREHSVHSSDSVKRERLSKADDADSAHLKPENMLKTAIAKITDKGGLVDFEGVEKLIKLMKPESGDKKLDLVSRVMIVDVISVTDRFDCLTRFVQCRGLHVIDEWLQEVHKGKIGDVCPKGSDKAIEEFIFALLRALDRLPVNLLALQTCNIGKSVNHLRSHKSSEIQKKARTLVDMWKKRVEAEMNGIETRSGTRRGGSWPNKSIMTDAKISTSQPSTLRGQQGKPSTGEPVAKSPESPVSVKLPTPSTTATGSSDSPSSEHQKTGDFCKDDAPSTSGTLNKNSSGVSHGTISNTVFGSTVAGVQKELGNGKNSSLDQNSPIKATPEGAADSSFSDNNNNQRLIVQLPNTGRSPASATSDKSSPNVHSEKQDHVIRSSSVIGDELPMDICQGKEGSVGSDDGKKGDLIPCGEEHGQDSELEGKPSEASYSSIKALVASCAEFAQANASASVPVGDDVGMTLLATVAAGERSRSGSSENKQPENTLKQSTKDGCKSEDNLKDVKMEQVSSIGKLSAQDGSQEPVLPPVNNISVDSKVATFGCAKTGELDSSVAGFKNAGKESEEATESNTVPSNPAASAKVETQINDESASRLSSEKQKESSKDSGLPTTSCGYGGLGHKAEDDKDRKTCSHAEQSDKANMHPDSSVLLQNGEHTQESIDKNEVSDKSHIVLVKEERACLNHTDVTKGDSPLSMPASETSVKLDFDLNEVLPSDDGIQGDVEKYSAVHMSCSLPPPSSLLPGNRSASVTVAAAAKGPFFPSENLLRGKAELGWKGSAATSAFRPAEPRKVIDVPDNRASKQARSFLDFDLNIGVVEDSPGCDGGLDLNLNACEESFDEGPLSVSTGRPSIPQLPPRSLLSARFSNPNLASGFDLNNGLNAEEIGGELVSHSRNGMQFLSNAPSVRMNNMDTRNFSSWFPPTAAYPTAILPGRGDQQSYPMAASQTMLNPGTSFNPELFKGPVLSSSHAVAYSSSTPFQFHGFPFETNFSLPSNSGYVGSSGGQLCFPTVPPQLVGPSGAISTPYRPYVMSLPGGGSNNVEPDNRKYGSQGLDLNSGPGGADLQLPQSVTNEQLTMFQHMTASGGGGLLKRKEPPVDGWDGSYKHHHGSRE